MEKLLVVDDINFERLALRAFLEDAYEIEEACDGEQAIRMLSEHHQDYACVLLDIMMPKIDGFGVLSWMKDAGLIGKLPVVALTAITEADRHVRCFEAGVSDLVEKPYDARVLKFKVESVLARANAANAPIEAPAKEEPVLVRDGSVSARAMAYLKDELGVKPDKAEQIVGKFGAFLKETAEKLRAMTDMSYDWMALREITHDLIGSSGNVGYTELGEDATMLNAAAHAQIAKAASIGIRHVLARIDAF